MLNIFHQHPLVTTTTTTTTFPKGPTSGSPSVSMTFEMDGIRVGFSQQLPLLHHLKRTAKAPDNKAGPQKEVSSSNYPFPGAFAVSFRDGSCVVEPPLKVMSSSRGKG